MLKQKYEKQSSIMDEFDRTVNPRYPRYSLFELFVIATKMFCAAFLQLQFGYVIFCPKILTKKLLVKC
jgi:hypothetical protein